MKENDERMISAVKTANDRQRKSVFGSRLQSLRQKAGLSQATFCTKFTAFMAKSLPEEEKKDLKTIPISTLSSWEIGAKKPNYETLIQIADYFSVSVDSLLGRETIPNEASDGKETDSAFIDKNYLFLEDFKLSLTLDEVRKKYAGKPVFIVPGDDETKGVWGIYNKKKKCFMCENVVLNEEPKFKYFSATRDSFPLSARIRRRTTKE